MLASLSTELGSIQKIECLDAIAIVTIVRIILYRLTDIFPYDRLNIYRDHPDHC